MRGFQAVVVRKRRSQAGPCFFAQVEQVLRLGASKTCRLRCTVSQYSSGFEGFCGLVIGRSGLFFCLALRILWADILLRGLRPLTFIRTSPIKLVLKFLETSTITPWYCTGYNARPIRLACRAYRFRSVFGARQRAQRNGPGSWNEVRLD